MNPRPYRPPDAARQHPRDSPSIGVSYFIQTQERRRLNITNAGHLPQPPIAPRWPVRTRGPGCNPPNSRGLYLSRQDQRPIEHVVR
jgi:hypothetical protein